MEMKSKQKWKELIEENEYILVGVGEEWESDEMGEELSEAYERLAGMLAGTDYFVVTTAMDGWIWKTDLDKNRIVAPCGNRNFLQCSAACCEEIWRREEAPEGGQCPRCGASLVPNTVEEKPYVEAGYLPQWKAYMTWLQRSLNRKLLLLELGVGFRTPTVIRWPFEKTAYLNQKSTFYRVHEKLFQLPDNLDGRGNAVAKNSVEWLCSL